jgi:sugar diacid utilization regulator
VSRTVIVVADCAVLSVEVDGEPVALLCAKDPDADSALLGFAASLAGIELSRRQALLMGRRELLGQVLDDLFRGRSSEPETTRRLVDHGFDLTQPHEVVVGRVQASEQRLRSHPWNLHALLSSRSEPHLRAIVDGQVVLVVPEGAGRYAASLCHEHLTRLGADARVGVSTSRQGVLGLRLGYFEARQASSSGPGVHSYRVGDLATALVIAAVEADAPLFALAAEALAPLLDHDERYGAALMTTFRTYLAQDCSPTATAEALFVHRNTLRNRLRLIEQLTGRCLGSPATRTHLWLATTAWALGPAPDPAAILALRADG